ncbi:MULTISPECIES: peptide ABC transporter substrate-binding protein [Salinicola]|jgi:oligopeptide transport system substrate-binding protein|uniref:peptide ABC transporter substrate-binding protein n=1 Tax=Salinicola salarius TaxID=430457 RepID=UPI0026F117D2|nr:peptide ABC transporter substrate-binding protein [Salinicola salarius]
MTIKQFIAGLGCTLMILTPPLAMAAIEGEKQVLRRANGAEPSTLDPQLATGTWESAIITDLFEGLVARDASGETIPGVASSWERSSDGLHYTFHLRDDAKWSDGTPLTAEDFVYSWRRILSPELAAPYAYMLFPIANAEAVNRGDKPVEALGVEASDPHTLEVTLARPTGYFIDMLGHASTYPVPKNAIATHGSDWTKPGHMVSNGAFELTDWVSHDHITAVRNRDFHDAENVALDEVRFLPIDDPRASLNRFRAGEVDMTGSVPLGRIEWTRENLPDALHETPILATFYFAFNQRPGSVLNDRRIREALNLALRRQVITSQITKLNQPSAYSLVPTAISDYDGPQFDFADESMDKRLARAKTLMKEAGYGPDHPLELTIDYITNQDTKRIPVAMAAMWKPLGVNVVLNNSDAAVYYSKLRQGNFQIGMAPWIADYDDASNFLDLFHTGVPNNHSGYSNTDYDALLDKAADTLDAEARNATMADAERLLLDDYAMLPLYFYIQTGLIAPALEGWRENPMNDHPSRWMHFNATD